MSRRHLFTVLLALAVAALLPAGSFGAGDLFDRGEGFADLDNRSGKVSPTAAQRGIVQNLGARAYWNRFGTPSSIIKDGGYLATGVAGATAADAARNWLSANKELFRLSSVDGLELVNDSRLVDSDAYAVTLRQTFGGLDAAEGGSVTVGLEGSAGAWKVAYASSSLTGATALAAAPALSPQEAWVRAARNIGRTYSVVSLRDARVDDGWTTYDVAGLNDVQRVRAVAVPTPQQGVRPAYEVLFLQNSGGLIEGYQFFVDSSNGAILARRNVVEQSHPVATQFSGEFPTVDGACDADKGPWVVGTDEKVSAITVVTTAERQANDIVLRLKRNGEIVMSMDVDTSPEAMAYRPDGGVPAGSYTVAVCEFANGTPAADPRAYSGTVVFTPSGGPLLGPKWKVFPANPKPATVIGHPWNVPSDDIRKTWCIVDGCDYKVEGNPSSLPWDVYPRTGQPTFTTIGNNAYAGEAWTNPLAPGPPGFRPVAPDRNYSFPWANQWFAANCSETAMVPGVGPDLGAAVTNLFVMHNRMHDWSYHLGFTEENWNAQDDNFDKGGIENDPVVGQTQAGALGGQIATPAGAPLGRDNANMRPLPDGIPGLTNMYLWQPLKGLIYPPCLDGDFDMAVIGHEYGHLIENRLIGKGGTRAGHHAGAMGESHGDLFGMEILNEYGFVPVAGESPYLVGGYATGNFKRGIRNFDMSQSPLNFSNMGYDMTGPQVHADGEIWSATNFEVRKLLNAKYDASFSSKNVSLQRECADGRKSPQLCPGNRRWITLVFDAMLLMPSTPTMLEARDAALAADMLRFGGANQETLWLGYARRGMGEGASSTFNISNSDTDPVPDFTSPRSSETPVTFRIVDAKTGQPVVGRVFAGRFEARTSPIADTNPDTSNPGPGADNLDDKASFVAGKYDVVVAAPGYGHHRFAISVSGTTPRTYTVRLVPNLASKTAGATAGGAGVRHADLIDDTENTNWESTGNVAGTTVTIDLAGTTAQSIKRVQASALLTPGQNRFVALRQFEVWVCNAAAGADCAGGNGFTKAWTSPADAFPGAAIRPGAIDLNLRSWNLPTSFAATHVRLVVLTNQCTGGVNFQGTQDADPASPSDCRTGRESDPSILVARDTSVIASELQVMTGTSTVTETTG